MEPQYQIACSQKGCSIRGAKSGWYVLDVKHNSVTILKFGMDLVSIPNNTSRIYACGHAHAMSIMSDCSARLERAEERRDGFGTPYSTGSRTLAVFPYKPAIGQNEKGSINLRSLNQKEFDDSDGGFSFGTAGSRGDPDAA